MATNTPIRRTIKRRPPNAFGRFLLNHGISCADFARLIGVSKQAVSVAAKGELEHGRLGGLVGKIADHHVTLEDIFKIYGGADHENL